MDNVLGDNPTNTRRRTRYQWGEQLEIRRDGGGQAVLFPVFLVHFALNVWHILDSALYCCLKKGQRNDDDDDLKKKDAYFVRLYKIFFHNLFH